jgi:molecular chaperone GrpE (heat shock protein)
MAIEPITTLATEVGKETLKESVKELAKEGVSEVTELGLEAEAVEATELLEAETAALNEAKVEVSAEFAEVKEQIQAIVDLIKSFEFDFENFISDPEYMLSKIGEANVFLKDLSTKITDILETDYVKDLIETLDKIDKILKQIQSSGSIDIDDVDDNEGLEGFGDGE